MSFAFTRSRWSSPSCDVVSLQSLAIILCLRNKMFRAISSRVSRLGSGNLTRTCASPPCIQIGTPASGLRTASPRAVSSHLSLLHESITSTTQGSLDVPCLLTSLSLDASLLPTDCISCPVLSSLTVTYPLSRHSRLSPMVLSLCSSSCFASFRKYLVKDKQQQKTT